MYWCRERVEEEDEIGKRVKRERDERATATATAAAATCLEGIWYIDHNQEFNQNQNNNPKAPEEKEIMGRRHMLGPPAGAASLNTITPCAACKLLRRRCAEECPFCPYFSPHEPHKFAAVHKVFGASNVSKMLMEVGESQRADAANSLVYEANVRLRDPVYGCMGAISALQQQVQTLQAELNAVRAEILKNKYREAAANTLLAAAAAAAVTTASNNSTTTASAVAASVVGTGRLVPQQPQPQSQSQPPPPATPPPSSASSVVSSSPVASNLYTPPLPNSTTTRTPAFTSLSTHHSVPYFD